VAKRNRLACTAAALLPLTLLAACSGFDGSSPSALPPTSPPSAAANLSAGSVPGAQAETGSGGMVKGCAAIRGCIAYIGVSYLSQTSAKGLGEAALDNRSGRFTRPTAATIRSALATFSSNTPASGAQSLINGPTGYPVINYEYAIVRMAQPSAATAAAIKGFMLWAITAGNAFKYLTAVNFQPLPGNVQTIAKKLIDKITAR
jgi:phosphate transport system substrate-binding protein